MKTLVLIIGLLLAGLAFVAPPLILILPALLVGLLLISTPMMLRGSNFRDNTGTRRDRGPTTGPTAR